MVTAATAAHCNVLHVPLNRIRHAARDGRLLRHIARISGCNVECAGARKETPSERALRNGPSHLFPHADLELLQWLYCAWNCVAQCVLWSLCKQNCTNFTNFCDVKQQRALWKDITSKTGLICSNYRHNAQFLYSITIYVYMLHYYPRHVSSINMSIFRRTNCTVTASGIVTLCKQLYSMPVENRLCRVCSEPVYCTVLYKYCTSLYNDARSE
jgi:hypothetical protein